MEKKTVKQHYTADELKQLFGDAYGQKKVSKENKEKLFNSHKNN